MTKAMQVDLEGRHALVTGGGTGIGQSISLALARCGATVIVNYWRSADAAEETVSQIENMGGRAVAVRADVTDESQVSELVQRAVQAYGGIDLLVANAGSPTEICPTHELSSEDWDCGLGVNCKSVFYCVKHVIVLLPNHRGRIIINSSISARSGGGPGMITYAAAKGALNNMVRGWAKELAPRGITVNAIAPGVIWTRIHQKNTDPEEYKKVIQRIPLGRDGMPDDCVGAVLLLAAPDGSYITGQIIEINGGLQMP
jgi:3-oxoacyl-[acyl-carrier protein] reductase